MFADADRLISSPHLTAQLGHSLQSDLDLLTNSLGIQAPTTIMLGGMHKLPGCTELIRRLGANLTSVHLLGEPFSPSRIPTHRDMIAVAHQAISAISLAIYCQLHSNHAAAQPGNLKLFRLLTCCRGKLASVLRVFLSEALTDDKSNGDGRESPLFDGVFLVANGEQVIEKGFLQPIFQRMFDNQEVLQWTSQHSRFHQRCGTVVWTLQFSCAILSLIFIAQILQRYF